MALELLLNTQRANRLVVQHARDPKLPGLEEILDQLVAATWQSRRMAGLDAEIQRAVEAVVLRGMLVLASSEQASAQVRALTAARVASLKSWMSVQSQGTADRAQRAHLSYALLQVGLWEKDPKQMSIPAAPEPPPGMPIGDCEPD
jgi:hypothetical protein